MKRRGKIDRLLALLRAGVEWNEAVRKVKKEKEGREEEGE